MQYFELQIGIPRDGATTDQNQQKLKSHRNKNKVWKKVAEMKRLDQN